MINQETLASYFLLALLFFIHLNIYFVLGVAYFHNGGAFETSLSNSFGVLDTGRRNYDKWTEHGKPEFLNQHALHCALRVYP